MTKIQLPLPPVLNTDQTYFAAGGTVLDVTNVRPWNGKWQVIGGWTRVTNNLSVSGTANAILEWKSSAGTSYIAIGTLTKLYVITGNTKYDITPTGTFTTAKWSLDTYGDTLIANESGGKIYQWSLNTAVAATQVTNAPTQVTAMVVTAERQIMAIGCNEESGGTFNARCVRVCDAEDITNWTTAADNLVYEFVIDGASPLVTGKNMTGGVALWTEAELYFAQFVGDPSQTYRFDRQGKQCGCIGLRGATIANGSAYWLTKDILPKVWTPGAGPVNIPCPILNDFRSNLQTANKADTFASHVAQFNEVWFTYTNSGTYIGRYAAVNLETLQWFKGTAGRRAMHQGLSNIIAVVNNGNIVNCETGQKGVGDSVTFLDWSIYSGFYYLNNAQDRLMLLDVWPDFEDQTGDITLQVDTSEYPQASSVAVQTVTFTTSTTRKNLRVSGRLARLTVSGSDVSGTTNTAGRLGTFTFDAAQLGQR